MEKKKTVYHPELLSKPYVLRKKMSISLMHFNILERKLAFLWVRDCQWSPQIHSLLPVQLLLKDTLRHIKNFESSFEQKWI